VDATPQTPGVKMIILSEHETFARLADGLRQAKDGALMMAQHQPDKAYMWMKMADTYEVCIQSVYKLSEERALAQTKEIRQ
jgi:hypothetical protein